MNKTAVTAVAVGVILNRESEIFITKRSKKTHLAGLWEFPGGKIEHNETPLQALQRELNEEVNIFVNKAILIKIISHQYVEKTVNLHFFLVTQWEGDIFATEGQASRWLKISELESDDFPEANQQIIKLLKEKI